LPSQALLTRGLEETEGLARLNMQLAQSKAISSSKCLDPDKVTSTVQSEERGARSYQQARSCHLEG